MKPYLILVFLMAACLAHAQQNSSPPPVSPNINGTEYAPANGDLQEEEDLSTENEERARRRRETDYAGTRDTPRKVRSHGSRTK